MTSRKSRSNASRYRRGPRGRTRSLTGEGYRREDDERPVRLSFKLFADETRVTRRFARREALTGKHRVGGVWIPRVRWMQDRMDAEKVRQNEEPLRRTISSSRASSRVYRQDFDFLLRFFIPASLFLLVRQYARINFRESNVHSDVNSRNKNKMCSYFLILKKVYLDNISQLIIYNRLMLFTLLYNFQIKINKIFL